MTFNFVYQDNYLSIDEFDNLVELIVESYGNTLVFQKEVGQTVYSRSIQSFTLMLGASEDTFESELESRNSFMMDGVHHARELTTVSQTVFQMLAVLYRYEA